MIQPHDSILFNHPLKISLIKKPIEMLPKVRSGFKFHEFRTGLPIIIETLKMLVEWLFLQ